MTAAAAACRLKAHSPGTYAAAAAAAVAAAAAEGVVAVELQLKNRAVVAVAEVMAAGRRC